MTNLPLQRLALILIGCVAAFILFKAGQSFIETGKQDPAKASIPVPIPTPAASPVPQIQK